MSKDQKARVRNIITEKDGKRDSKNMVNKEKDLSGKFCNRPFDFAEAHDLGTGKVFVCCLDGLYFSIYE